MKKVFVTFVALLAITITWSITAAMNHTAYDRGMAYFNDRSVRSAVFLLIDRALLSIRALIKRIPIQLSKTHFNVIQAISIKNERDGSSMKLNIKLSNMDHSIGDLT